MSDDAVVGGPGTAEAPASPADLLDVQADAAEDFLNGLLDVWDDDGEAVAEIEGEAVAVELSGPTAALLIGRHGATLEALEDLTRAAVQHSSGARCLLTVDIEGYRARNRERLERRVRGLARRALETGQSIELEPMSAADRRIVHSLLSEHEGVTTQSEGEGEERRVVISPG